MAAAARAAAARGRAAAEAAGWIVAAAAPVEEATRALLSSAISFAWIALESSVAICCSIVEVTLRPKPHANTVTPSPLTSAAASTTVSNSVLPGAASTVCSPSERSSTILVAPTRGSPSSIPSKSCRTASKPSEIEVLPPAVISSIPVLITAASYDHGTRVVASAAKDTTEKRAAFTPSEYWLTSCLAKAFDPLAPSMEPSGLGFFIEPLSSSSSAKSIGVAQEGMGGGRGDGGGGGGGGGGGEGGGGEGGGKGGGKGGDSLQMNAVIGFAFVGSEAIPSSVVLFNSSPKPHANTVAGRLLTVAAAAKAVSSPVMPGAASTVCSPSERNSTILAASLPSSDSLGVRRS
eukprot:scaffold12374_cov60-Phaeocystis_antarctica.AAC.3